jgi:hypothetical protein
MNKLFPLLIFFFSAGCVAKPEVRLETILRDSQKIYLLEIDEGKVVNDCKGNHCYKYGFSIGEVVKGESPKKFKFLSNCRLTVGHRYVVAFRKGTYPISMMCLKVVPASTGKTHAIDQLLGLYENPAIIFPKEIPLTYRVHEICDRDCKAHMGETVFNLGDLVKVVNRL